MEDLPGSNHQDGISVFGDLCAFYNPSPVGYGSTRLPGRSSNLTLASHLFPAPATPSKVSMRYPLFGVSKNNYQFIPPRQNTPPARTVYLSPPAPRLSPFVYSSNRSSRFALSLTITSIFTFMAGMGKVRNKREHRFKMRTF